MKDRFSSNSLAYANFRPGYPAALVTHILAHTPARTRAWDCATGNGQMAALLAPHFEWIEATDMSANQLAQATTLPNVHYSQQAAEQTIFTSHKFDLITVAQAIHWFDFERFYEEVRRVAAPGAVLAVVGYPLFSVAAEAVDAVIRHFYFETIAPYWDIERRYLDAHYTTIPFPFAEIPSPSFESEYDWQFEQLMGYLSTWSAVKNCMRETAQDPLVALESELRAAWGNAEMLRVRFPMVLRMGIV